MLQQGGRLSLACAPSPGLGSSRSAPLSLVRARHLAPSKTVTPHENILDNRLPWRMNGPGTWDLTGVLHAKGIKYLYARAKSTIALQKEFPKTTERHNFICLWWLLYNPPRPPLPLKGLPWLYLRPQHRLLTLLLPKAPSFEGLPHTSMMALANIIIASFF